MSKTTFIPPTSSNVIVTRRRLINTLIDTPETLEKDYSSPYPYQCWYCDFEFADRPYPYPEPKKYFPRTREILPDGYYCMPSCVLAAILYRNSNNGQQLEWFRMMMRDVYK